MTTTPKETTTMTHSTCKNCDAPVYRYGPGPDGEVPALMGNPGQDCWHQHYSPGCSVPTWTPAQETTR